MNINVVLSPIEIKQYSQFLLQVFHLDAINFYSELHLDRLQDFPGLDVIVISSDLKLSTLLQLNFLKKNDHRLNPVLYICSDLSQEIYPAFFELIDDVIYVDEGVDYNKDKIRIKYRDKSGKLEMATIG